MNPYPVSRFWLLVSLVGFGAGLMEAQPPPTMAPPVRGIHEMVGAANNFEVEAGYRILTQGGNAVDAGVATVLAASVTELSRFGLGGEMPLLVKMAGQPPVAISGIGVAPAKATVEYYQHRSPEPWEDAAHMPPVPDAGDSLGHHAGRVRRPDPGALEKYGTKSFAEVAAPAIEYAEQGFPMPEEFGNMLRGYQRIITLWPDSMKFFYPDGVPTPRGEVFREPMLAKTLRELVAAEKKARGKRPAKLKAVRDLFYKGSIAKRIADFCGKNGGLIAYEDMANFHAEADQPKQGTYRGYEVYKPGFWTQGPVMIEALNMLEGYDLKAMGHNSPQYLHTVVEAVKLAFADRDEYYGDPKFSKIPEGDAAIQRLRDGAAEADRSGAGLHRAPAGRLRQTHHHSVHAGCGGRGERYHLRQRGGSPGQCIFGHAQRRMAAIGDRGRYRNPTHQPAAIVRDDARPSQSIDAGKAPARNAESHAGHARRQTRNDHVHSRRRQPGPGAAAGFSEYRGIRHDAAGSRGSAALPDRAFLQLVRQSRIRAGQAEPGGPDSQGDGGCF